MTTRKKNQIFYATLVMIIIVFCFIGCGVKKSVEKKESVESSSEIKGENKIK